jgi:hypothetical protein
MSEQLRDREVTVTSIHVTSIGGDTTASTTPPFEEGPAFDVVVDIPSRIEPFSPTYQLRCLIYYPGRSLPYTEIDQPVRPGISTTYSFTTAPDTTPGSPASLMAQLLGTLAGVSDVVLAVDGPYQVEISS